jgi:hypothetical protein
MALPATAGNSRPADRSGKLVALFHRGHDDVVEVAPCCAKIGRAVSARTIFASNPVLVLAGSTRRTRTPCSRTSWSRDSE